MTTRVPANRYLLYGLAAAAGLTLDLWSKSKVSSALGFEHKESAPILDGWVSFRLHTSFNKGALWGFGQNHTWLFASLSIIAVIGIAYWLFVRGAAATSRWLTVALGLITAGTLGNLWDRLGLHGCVNENGRVFAVRDFFYFRFGSFDWAIFNVADVCLVTGAIMLVLHSFVPEKQPADQLAPEGEKNISVPAGPA